MSQTRISRRDLVATAAIVPLAAAVSATTAEAARDKNMEAALAALQSARQHLRAAGPGKGGHRAEAIRLVEAAIVQVQQGIDATS